MKFLCCGLALMAATCLAERRCGNDPTWKLRHLQREEIELPVIARGNPELEGYGVEKRIMRTTRTGGTVGGGLLTVANHCPPRRGEPDLGNELFERVMKQLKRHGVS